MKAFRVVTSMAVVFATAMSIAAASEIELYQVTYPERKEIEVAFARTEQAPQATMVAEVEYREGQADMNIRFKDMKPAILFGGDVTSYVLWAITPDGTVENLGELWVREESQTIEYSTGLKAFAMLVTAETIPMVGVPSELVMFWSEPAKSKQATTSPFTYSGFGPAPAHEYPSIAMVIWDHSQPLDLRQAEKAYELAVAADANDYAPSLMRRATTTLAQARAFTSGGKNKSAVDYSRRALTQSAEALQMTTSKKEAEAVAAEIARRKAEMEALQSRATEAEASAAEAASALAEAQKRRQEADAAVAAAQRQLSSIEAERLELQASVSALGAEAAALEKEKAELSNRLAGALSKVADTQASARGMIVSLPDILFDTNEATLKNEARVVIAKLAGILLILPELNLRIEGFTDSTGSAEYNQALSERRAMSVRDFLAQQGIDGQRMVAVGYGMERPVADNSTREGRAKNRRVEIVIAEGSISE